MIVGRLVGWLIFLTGLVALGHDAYMWFETRRFAPAALGELWYKLHPNSLQLFQPAVQRYLHPALWDDMIQPVLLWWASPTLIILGLALILLFRRRPRGYFRR